MEYSFTRIQSTVALAVQGDGNRERRTRSARIVQMGLLTCITSWQLVLCGGVVTKNTPVAPSAFTWTPSINSTTLPTLSHGGTPCSDLSRHTNNDGYLVTQRAIWHGLRRMLRNVVCQCTWKEEALSDRFRNATQSCMHCRLWK